MAVSATVPVPQPARPLVAGVPLLALTVVAVALLTLPVPPWQVLPFAAAALLAELFPVPIEGVAAGATSFASVFLISLTVLEGWRIGVLIAAATMLAAEAWKRMPRVQVAYNAALYVLGAAAAGAVHQVWSPLHLGLVPAAAFYLVNLTLLAAVIRAVRGGRLIDHLRAFFGSALIPVVMMASTVALIVLLWQKAGPGYTLLVVPSLLINGVYQRRNAAQLEERRHLDLLKDEMVAVISHEIRTPLTMIVGGIETFARPDLPLATKEKLLPHVRAQSARLTSVLDDVLVVSRLERQTQSHQFAVVPVGELIDPILETVRRLAPANVTVSADLDPVTVRCDVFGLGRVLNNLVDNAVKYSPDGGAVEIAAFPVGDAVRFEVRDQGIGVPEDQREKIFEKFTRLDPGMNRGVGGTGLGLWICREIVRQMGGELTVHTRAGGGSVFAFDIPTTGGDVR